MDNNEQVIVQRGKDKSYTLVSVPKSDRMYLENDFYAKIEKSIEQAKNSQTTSFDSIEDFKRFLEL